MDMYEVVTKLVGPVMPVGETHADEKRLENLRQMIALAESLVAKLSEVAELRGRPEHSVSMAGKAAHSFLREAREVIGESLQDLHVKVTTCDNCPFADNDDYENIWNCDLDAVKKVPKGKGLNCYNAVGVREDCPLKRVVASVRMDD